ncbi:MAG: uracil-DNA glycosylase [Rhodospirillaceae bacterium]|nr:uracil-DNA glycosylase [Rhodospirillaceae bacterium]
MVQTSDLSDADAASLLAWQVAAGADEAILDEPVDRTRPQPSISGPAIPAPPPATPRGVAEAPPAFAGAAAPLPPRPAIRPAASPPRPVPASTPLVAQDAKALAASCKTIAELEQAVRVYDGCGLKKTATNTVFADGNPGAKLMFVGEAPGADEDRQGKPFVGLSGKLLDRMLQAIGYDRTSAYITNILFWRPPGNRQPTPQEIQQCLPFVVRHIELVRPDVLVLLGGTSAKTILNQTEGILRLRGRWFEYRTDESLPVIPAIPTLHPAYLLRSPGQKREAWRDFLSLKLRLSDAG